MIRSLRLLPALAAFFLASHAAAQTVVAWGGNLYGQTSPPANLRGVAQVSAGYYHALALKSDGTVAAWGNDEAGQIEVPAGLANVVQVAAAGYRSVALRANGTVVAWGADDGEGVPAGLSGVVRISAGTFHTLALKADGTVTAWGNDDNGQCDIPAGLANVVAIAAGDFHSLALKSDGTVVAWGDDTFGEATVPSGLTNVTGIAAGGYHSLARRSDGTVAAWGANDYGQRTPPAGLTGVARVEGGYAHSIALRADGSPVLWGDDGAGQLDVPAGLNRLGDIAGGADFTVAVVPLEVSLDRASAYVGESVTGTVTLLQNAPQGGTVVQLSSNDPTIGVPPTVTVPAGSKTATFPVMLGVGFHNIPEGRVLANQSGAVASAKLSVTGQTAALACSHASIVGGSTTNPYLTLTLAWPVTMATTLAIEADPGLGLPASLTVPAGSKSVKVSFVPGRVTTDLVRTVVVRSGAEAAASVAVKVIPLKATVSFSDPVLDGGLSTLGFVYLNAPVRDAITIPISSADPSVRPLVASVRVGIGARQAHFDLVTDPVPVTKSVRVTATVNGNSYYATLKVVAVPAVKSLTLGSYVYGTNRLVGTVRLTVAGRAGGTLVNIASSDPSLIVPSTVLVPEGQYSTTFEAWATDTPATKSTVVTAGTAAGSASTGVEVRALAVSSFTISSTTVAGGETLTGTITLNAVVGSDTTVEVTSQYPGVAIVPSTVTVPAGAKTVTFNFATASPGASAKSVKITAAKNGTSAYRTLKVNP